MADYISGIFLSVAWFIFIIITCILLYPFMLKGCKLLHKQMQPPRRGTTVASSGFGEREAAALVGMQGCTKHCGLGWGAKGLLGTPTLQHTPPSTISVHVSGAKRWSLRVLVLPAPEGGYPHEGLSSQQALGSTWA